MSGWQFIRNDKVFGPVSDREFLRLAESAEIPLKTKVAHPIHTKSQWVEAGRIPAFRKRWEHGEAERKRQQQELEAEPKVALARHSLMVEFGEDLWNVLAPGVKFRDAVLLLCLCWLGIVVFAYQNETAWRKRDNSNAAKEAVRRIKCVHDEQYIGLGVSQGTSISGFSAYVQRLEGQIYRVTGGFVQKDYARDSGFRKLGTPLLRKQSEEVHDANRAGSKRRMGNTS